MEDTLQSLVDWLQKLAGLPACAITVVVCVVFGYILQCIKRFPNAGIPVAVILLGGVLYPMIADDNNAWTFRVWLVRNAGIGLIFGWLAWMFHNQFLKRVEAKLGLGSDLPEPSGIPEVPKTLPK